MYNRAYDAVSEERLNEDEGIYTIGDDIAFSFVCGNFKQGIEELIEFGVSPMDLGEYLQSQADEIGFDSPCNEQFYYGHFDFQFMALVGTEYQEAKRA